jgi:putative transposase
MEEFMARLPRICPPGIPQHIIQRGNNRQVCFADTADFAAYSAWLYEASCKYGVDVHAWVLMTNHVHLLVTPQFAGGVSRMMQTVGRRYVRFFNQSYRRKGTLWEGRFKSCLVDTEGYFLACQRYIELNPVRAGMVACPADYPWSSYQANALGVVTQLRTPHKCYLNLASTDAERREVYRCLFDMPIGDKLLGDIRSAMNKGLALGNERFKDELEALTGRHMRPGRPGPRRK